MSTENYCERCGDIVGYHDQNCRRAEQPAPTTVPAAVSEGERRQFEAWCSAERYRFVTLNRLSDGRYAHPGIESDWEVWQARAALKAQPAPTEAPITFEDVQDAARLAWSVALDSAAFYVAGHCASGEFHAETILEMPMPAIKFRGEEAPTEAQGEDSARLDSVVEVSYELVQDDMVVAGASGLGAERDIAHYAMVYGQDGPVEVYRVTRQKIDAARATADTGKVGA